MKSCSELRHYLSSNKNKDTQLRVCKTVEVQGSYAKNGYLGLDLIVKIKMFFNVSFG